MEASVSRKGQSNAGIEHFNDLDKVTSAEIDQIFAVNVKGQFFVAQQAGRHMEPGGRLILMSSISSIMVSPPSRPLHKPQTNNQPRASPATQSTQPPKPR